MEEASSCSFAVSTICCQFVLPPWRWRYRGDGADAHTSTLACCHSNPGVFGTAPACHLAKVVQHLGKREHQRWRKAIIVAVMGIAIVHTGVNLRVVFRFGDVHLFTLLVEFPTASLMAGCRDGWLDASPRCACRGGLTAARRHAAIQEGSSCVSAKLSGNNHRRRISGECGHRYQALMRATSKASSFPCHVPNKNKYSFISEAGRSGVWPVPQVLSGQADVCCWLTNSSWWSGRYQASRAWYWYRCFLYRHGRWRSRYCHCCSSHAGNYRALTHCRSSPPADRRCQFCLLGQREVGPVIAGGTADVTRGGVACGAVQHLINQRIAVRGAGNDIVMLRTDELRRPY